MNKNTSRNLTLSCAIALGLAAPWVASADVPENIRVPEGHTVALETVGVGKITYECRAKADTSEQMEWVFVGPKAALNDRNGKQVGEYWGPPATWALSDGSKVTGKQLAVAPAGDGNIPYQLVEANPAEGKGMLEGTRYIQRVALKGGVAPAKGCMSGNKGERVTVPYQADYLFWKKA